MLTQSASMASSVGVSTPALRANASGARTMDSISIGRPSS